MFRLNRLLTLALCAAAVTLLVAAMLGICFEVALRILGKGSISGLMESTEYALFFSTFFATPYLLRENQHIRVDIVTARLPASARAVCEYFVLIVIMVISGILFVIGARILAGNFAAGVLVFKDIVFPHWWLDWVIPLSAVAIGLQALEKFLELRREPFAASPEA